MWKISCVWIICCNVLLEKRKCGKALCLENDVGVTWGVKKASIQCVSCQRRKKKGKRSCMKICQKVEISERGVQKNEYGAHFSWAASVQRGVVLSDNLRSVWKQPVWKKAKNKVPKPRAGA